MCFKQHRLAARFVDLSHRLGASCRDDFMRSCFDKPTAIEEAALECCSRQLFLLLKSLKPWVPRRSCRIINASGLPAASDAEERTIIKMHFQGKLEASDGKLADLIVEDRLEQPTRPVAAAVVVKSIEAIPTLP